MAFKVGRVNFRVGKGRGNKKSRPTRNGSLAVANVEYLDTKIRTNQVEKSKKKGQQIWTNANNLVRDKNGSRHIAMAS